MPPFFLIGTIVHASAIAVVAFFVFFAAKHAEGTLRIAGHLLGVWLIVVCIGAVALGIVEPRFHGPMPPPLGQPFCPPDGKLPTQIVPRLPTSK
jgi:hypothetical protein